MNKRKLAAAKQFESGKGGIKNVSAGDTSIMAEQSFCRYSESKHLCLSGENTLADKNRII